MPEPILSMRDVRVSFDTRQGLLHAVRGVDLDLHAGETLAIVGESGSGKSALARAIVQMNQPPYTPNRTHVSGRIDLCLDGERDELVGCSRALLQRVRARKVAMIAQESLSGLNPVLRIGWQIGEALAAARPDMDRGQRKAAVLQIIEEVDLPDPKAAERRYPHQLSGGQRQRVMIAIAAIRSPRILIADEPTTALDVTVQARILELLRALGIGSKMGMLFISHDLAVVAQIADRVAVMYAGQIVETAPTGRFFASPRHPYAAALLAMQPGNAENHIRLKGQVPSPFAVPSGCAFRQRCDQAGSVCATAPEWQGSAADGYSCWRPCHD